MEKVYDENKLSQCIAHFCKAGLKAGMRGSDNPYKKYVLDALKEINGIKAMLKITCPDPIYTGILRQRQINAEKILFLRYVSDTNPGRVNKCKPVLEALEDISKILKEASEKIRKSHFEMNSYLGNSDFYTWYTEKASSRYERASKDYGDDYWESAMWESVKEKITLGAD